MFLSHERSTSDVTTFSIIITSGLAHIIQAILSMFHFFLPRLSFYLFSTQGWLSFFLFVVCHDWMLQPLSRCSGWGTRRCLCRSCFSFAIGVESVVTIKPKVLGSVVERLPAGEPAVCRQPVRHLYRRICLVCQDMKAFGRDGYSPKAIRDQVIERLYPQGVESLPKGLDLLRSLFTNRRICRSCLCLK